MKETLLNEMRHLFNGLKKVMNHNGEWNDKLFNDVANMMEDKMMRYGWQSILFDLKEQEKALLSKASEKEFDYKTISKKFCDMALTALFGAAYVIDYKTYLDREHSIAVTKAAAKAKQDEELKAFYEKQKQRDEEHKIFDDNPALAMIDERRLAVTQEKLDKAWDTMLGYGVIQEKPELLDLMTRCRPTITNQTKDKTYRVCIVFDSLSAMAGFVEYRPSITNHLRYLLSNAWVNLYCRVDGNK